MAPYAAMQDRANAANDVICGVCPENRMFSPEPAAGSLNPYRLAKLVAQRLTIAQ